MTDALDGEKKHRPLRSYGRRYGRITRGQKRALAELGEKILIPFTGDPIDFSRHFVRTQKLAIDLGCGMGDGLVHLALTKPDFNFIGVDVYQPGIARSCALIDERHLDNARLIHHDAVELFQKGIERHSIHALYILFPDPWPKKRHHKRRLIQPAFLALVRRMLAPGGTCAIATDWAEYADHIVQVFDSDRSFIPQTTPDPETLKLDDHTKFGLRGRRESRSITLLVYTTRSY